LFLATQYYCYFHNTINHFLPVCKRFCFLPVIFDTIKLARTAVEFAFLQQ
jgi:hypothetical protein